MITNDKLQEILESINKARLEGLNAIRELMIKDKDYPIVEDTDGFEEDEEPEGIFARIDDALGVMVNKVRLTAMTGLEFHAYELEGEPCDIWLEDWRFETPVHELLAYIKCDEGNNE